MSCKKNTRMGTGSTPTNAATGHHIDLLTTVQVSAMTGITVFSLEEYRSLRNKGLDRGPRFVKRGRSVLYERLDVEKYIARCGV